MESYLKMLQTEKAELEEQLKGMLAKSFEPFDVTPQGKKVHTTQEHINAVRARLDQVETDIMRETEREP
jgi:uncharacterized protein YaaN involved in tellurite resistance